MKVKKAAQTEKGYKYQSLYAAKLMIEALNYKNEYERFIVEADNNDIAFSSLDDIVCFKGNNEVDYYQVKHTDNILRYSLSFDWLLDKDRNILVKMFNSYKEQIAKETENNKIGNIFFITPRESDICFHSCLDDHGSLIYEKINKKNLDIINKLFGEDVVIFKKFLKVLIFKTTEDYDLLEYSVKNELNLFSNEHNFDKYIRIVEQWATNKNIPNKDGIINKDNIKNALLNKKESLDQNFTIDQDYIELKDFSKKFEKQIKKNKLIVLYGDAGTGKSSFITNFFKDIKNYIRHYYFLSVNQPNNIERINIKNIEESLKEQLKEISNENFENSNLKEMIERHDLNCNIKSNPFYIVIDGIDHVHRNNKNNITPLSDFIGFILSLKLKNTKIIISTQMSELNIYPDILLKKSPKKEWLEINKLTKEDVLKYIKNQNFIIKDQLDSNKITEILYEKTQGHPLLLHYIKEDLKKTNIISKDKLDEIQVCKTINDYYDYILSNIDRYEKFTLLLMSKYNFVWYKKYLQEIINLTFNADIIDDENKIENNNIHFLFKKMFNNGFTFYHESLIRYVKEKTIIEKSNEKEYTLKLNEWIKFEAPEHIRNIWGKILTIEKDGVTNDIDYDWIAKRVSEGYSFAKLKELLSICIKKSRSKKSYEEMHYFDNLLYRLRNEYNLFLDAEALIEIYSNCKKEILFENLDIIYNNSLKSIYILAYISQKRNDCVELLNYAKLKFDNYNNYLKSKQVEIDSDDIDRYYDLLYIMFSDVNCFRGELPKTTYLTSHITLENNIIIEFKEIKDVEKIYRKSSEDNKKQLTLFLSLQYLKNHQKTKAMYFLFNVVKKDVCLETNTIIINDEDKKYFNLYFSYFLKCYYLRIKKGDGVKIRILDNSSNSINYLSSNFKYAIKSIIDYIRNDTNIDFENVFNIGITKCNPAEHYYLKKDKDFNEFKILISCLIHFFKTPNKLLDIQSINFFLEDNNIKKSIIFKLDNFLKIKIFDNNSILNIKNKIQDEFLFKIFTNDLEGDENEYFLLFRLLNKYDQFSSDLLFEFCRISLSYGFSKDTSIYSLIFSLTYLSDVDKKNTLILLNEISPQIYYLSEFTNLKELKPAICLFNSLLDKLFPKTEKELNAVKKYLDLQNLENYKNSKIYLDYNKDEYLNNRINERSSSFNESQTSENYLNNGDNWYSSIHFPDDFFYHVDNFLSIFGNDKNLDAIITKLIYNKSSNIFPYDKLVYVFCKRGQHIKALKLIKMFIKIFIEETEYLNIPAIKDI